VTVPTLAARNKNQTMVVPVVGSAFGGSLESGGRFCVGAFGRNLASVAMKMLSHLIYLKKINFINFVLSMRFAKTVLQ
jgi:hypothetical protein